MWMFHSGKLYILQLRSHILWIIEKPPMLLGVHFRPNDFASNSDEYSLQVNFEHLLTSFSRMCVQIFLPQRIICCENAYRRFNTRHCAKAHLHLSHRKPSTFCPKVFYENINFGKVIHERQIESTAIRMWKWNEGIDHKRTTMIRIFIFFDVSGGVGAATQWIKYINYFILDANAGNDGVQHSPNRASSHHNLHANQKNTKTSAVMLMVFAILHARVWIQSNKKHAIATTKMNDSQRMQVSLDAMRWMMIEWLLRNRRCRCTTMNIALMAKTNSLKQHQCTTYVT